jgi:hypothetical protein
MDKHHLDLTALDIDNLEHLLRFADEHYYELDLSSEQWLKEFTERLLVTKRALEAGKRLAAEC